MLATRNVDGIHVPYPILVCMSQITLDDKNSTETTEGEKSRVMQAIQAGVTDYLVKPFTVETLKEKLEKHGC